MHIMHIVLNRVFEKSFDEIWRINALLILIYDLCFKLKTGLRYH